MSKWRVNAIGKNRAEVFSPRVRYVIRADSTSLTLRVFAGERSLEKVSIRHVGRKYSWEGIDSAGRSERRTMRFAGKRVTSNGIIAGKRFELESSLCVHGGLLIAALKKRRPLRLPHINALLKQLKTDGRLRGQLRSHVDMAMMIKQPDSTVVACLIICAECYLIGTPIACVLCDLCLNPGGG